MVTGGAGFIGSHLVDALLKKGYRVRVLDSLKPPAHNGKLPEWFNRKADFIRGDVFDRKVLTKALGGVGSVFHLAGYMDYLPSFSRYFTTNASSTALLYEIIKEKRLPIGKIVVVSSQAVYGEGKYECSQHGVIYAEPRPENRLKKQQWEALCPYDRKVLKPLPEKEDDWPNPQTPYGISKLAGEKTAMVLGKIYNIPTTIVRYSIVHGIRQSFRNFYSGALRVFAVQALNRKPLTLHEDGNQSRDFVNVKDVTSAHLKILEDQRTDFEVFNIGSGRTARVLDLAKAVAQVTGVSSNFVIRGEYRLHTPRHQMMDISKLRRLGWKPKSTLEDNVKEYVQWVSRYPEALDYLRRNLSVLAKEKVIR